MHVYIRFEVVCLLGTTRAYNIVLRLFACRGLPVHIINGFVSGFGVVCMLGTTLAYVDSLLIGNCPYILFVVVCIIVGNYPCIYHCFGVVCLLGTTHAHVNFAF